MRLVILGGPGAGKGTQAGMLCPQLGIRPISTGDILRTAIAAKDSDGESQTELGRQAQQYVERGELVPDPIMIQFIRQRLLAADVAGGWLLDGYPRTAFQAEELDFLLDDLGQQLTFAIWIDVPAPVLLDRSIARARLDDQPDLIHRRIALFEERTRPLLDYYEFRDRLIQVKGDQPPEQVTRDILHKLRL